MELEADIDADWNSFCEYDTNAFNNNNINDKHASKQHVNYTIFKMQMEGFFFKLIKQCFIFHGYAI